ncbi:MAG: hypothetical protein QMD14_02755 [Candidatus Aenigmarchaeota archaeon]|nr:hypothetical protein [Candidatus Aenigmarchaeota archaeon]
MTTKRENLVDYVLATDRRKIVLLTLAERSIARPAELATYLKVSNFLVFKAIHELEEKGLVKALECRRKTWKRYKITKLGKRIIKDLDKRI